MGNRKQGFKAKTLEQAIDKLKTGEPLTEKEISLCVKILSKKVIKEAIVDTSDMNEFFGLWKHVCPSCGAEVTTGDENTTCICGQLLRCPPYSEWQPKFIKNHVYDETEDKWIEGKPVPKEPVAKDINAGHQRFMESARDRLTRLGVITPAARIANLKKTITEDLTAKLVPIGDGFSFDDPKPNKPDIPEPKTAIKSKTSKKQKADRKQKPKRHKAPSTRSTRTRRIT